MRQREAEELPVIERLLREDRYEPRPVRSILRKRDKRKGRGRGLDHNRYPNAWFAGKGLVFLTTSVQT